MNIVQAVAQEIVDRTAGQISTHYDDCYKYHLSCFAVFVLQELGDNNDI